MNPVDAARATPRPGSRAHRLGARHRAGRRFAMALLPVSAALVVLPPSPSASPARAGDPVADTLTFVPNPASRADTVSARTAACAAIPAGTVDAAPIGLGTLVLLPDPLSEKVSADFRVPDTAKTGSFTILGSCAAGRRIKGTLGIERTWVGTHHRHKGR